jgi:hypothetical protein
MNKAFKLSKKFLEKFENRKPPFGFNGFGELVYMRTYSRIKADGQNEKWFETVERVVNGTYNMQKRWIESRGLGWDNLKAQRSAQEMYERIFTMKFLPPGRGLTMPIGHVKDISLLGNIYTHLHHTILHSKV